MRAFLAKLSNRDRRALLLGALIAVPAVVHRAAVRPYLAALEQARSAVAQERALLQRELTLLAHVPKMPAEIVLARRDAAAAAARLFGGDDAIEATSALSSYVGNALRNSNVTIQQIESRDAKVLSPGGSLREVSIEVRAEGALGAVLRALRSLESGPRLVRVTRVSVERSLSSLGPGTQESLVIAATVRGYARLAAAEANTQ